MKNMSGKSSSTCDICEKSFKRHTSMIRHKRNIHEVSVNDSTRSSRMHCPSEDCQFIGKTLSEVRDHLRDVHTLYIKHSSLQFNNEEEFLAWKKKEEKDTKSSFVKHRAAKKLVNSLRHYYRCFRSGAFSNVSKANESIARNLKRQGSCKMGAVCPAEMIVDFFPDQDEIIVNYYQTHHGHDNELIHLRLTAEERTEIAEKLRRGVSIDAVLDEFRDNTNINPDDRLFLLTRKDLHNIVLTRDVEVDCEPRKSNVLSADISVANIWNTQQHNPVLYYKKQDDVDPNLMLDAKDFMLILMTPHQKDTLLKYGAELICVDSTQGTNMYDFQLNTVMVIDNHNEAHPVAFCLSSRIDGISMQVFFDNIKKFVGPLRTKIYMGYDLISYNAWKHVMQPVEQYLLNTWQVDRLLKNSMFNKITKKQKIPNLYKTLRKLHIEESYSNEFETNLTEFLNTLNDDEDMAKFRDYFIKYYSKNFKYWAHCYRKRSLINADLRFAGLHRTLKRIFFEKSANNDIDHCFDSLLKFIKSREEDASSNSAKVRLTSALKEINENHTRGSLIPYRNIDSVDFNKWKMSSPTCPNTYHAVEKIQEECSYKNCVLRCDDCNICIHSFLCNCSDYSSKNTICEHIHCIVSYCNDSKYGLENIFVDIVENDASPLTSDREDTTDFHIETQSENFSNDAKEKLNLIDSLLPDSDIDEDCQEVVLKKLDEVVEILLDKNKRSKIRIRLNE